MYVGIEGCVGTWHRMASQAKLGIHRKSQGGVRCGIVAGAELAKVQNLPELK
jgi:hypothetical protein